MTSGAHPAPRGLPLVADLSGRRVLVAGGGAVATRKLPALVDAAARIDVVAPAATPTIRELAADGTLAWHERPVSIEDLDGAWLAVAATDDPSVNAELAAAASARRLWCIRADAGEGENGSVSSMGVIRRGRLTIATTTGGSVPALTRALAAHLEAQIGPEWAQLADVLADLRTDPRVVAAMADLDDDERAARWRSLTSPDTLLSLRNDPSSAKDVALACLCSPSA